MLLCRHPDWVLADLWPDETDPPAAVAHGLQILLSMDSGPDDLPIIRQMLQGALQPQTKDRCFWFEAAPDEMAAYLLLRAFALDAKLQNPLIQLKGLQIFSLEMPLDRFEPDAAKVIAALRSNKTHWRDTEQRAEAFLTPQRAERLTDLIAAATGANAIDILTSPALLFPYLRQRLRDFFQQVATTWPSISEAGTASGTAAATWSGISEAGRAQGVGRSEETRLGETRPRVMQPLATRRWPGLRDWNPIRWLKAI